MPVAPKPKSRKTETGFDNEKALDFIRQGGSQSQGDETAEQQPQTVVAGKGRHTTKTDPNDQVSISIKLLVSERNQINDNRAKLSGRDKKSLEGWIIEAITEKLERENKRKN